MGQKQLLLIVLGIIIIGISISIANQLFDANTENANRDSIAYELVNLGTTAQKYYNKPEEMGGGAKSFVDWEIPTNLDSTLNGYYNISSVGDEKIIINGYPYPERGYNWYMQSTITKEEIVTEINILILHSN